MTRAEQLAIGAVVYLAGATNDEGWRLVSQQAVAEAIGCTPRYIEVPMQKLSNAGIISSRRGSGGGYAFGGRENLTLWQVLQAIRDKAPRPASTAVGRYIDDLHEAAYRGVRVRDMVTFLADEEATE